MSDKDPTAANGTGHAGEAGLDALEEAFHADASAPAIAEPVVIGGGAGDDSIDRVALRSTHLGRRLASRRGYALAATERKTKRLFGSWALLALGLLGAWGFAGALPDLRYWLSSAQPVDLGKLGAYSLANVTEGAYVKVEGVASPKRGAWSRMFSEHEIFPLIASRILIDRRKAPDPAMKGYGFRYSGAGRLSIASEDSRWAGVREQFASQDEVSKDGLVVVIEDGVVPHRGVRAPLEAAVWLALTAAAVIVLARRTFRRA